jgi:acyl carrier protein
MSIEDRVRQYIVTGLNYPGSPADLTDDLPLIANGVIDSLGLMSLVSFIESDFALEVADEELVPANFGTLASIGSLIRSKQQA